MFRSTQLKVDHLCRLFSEPGGKNVDGLCTLCCKISGFETSYESLSRVSKIEVVTFIEFPRDIFNCTCGVTFIFNLYKTQTSRGYRIISLCVQCVIALLPQGKQSKQVENATEMRKVQCVNLATFQIISMKREQTPAQAKFKQSYLYKLELFKPEV